MSEIGKLLILYGAGLYISTILRPPTHALSLLTIAAGVLAGAYSPYQASAA